MSEALARTKKVQAGHRRSVIRLMHQLAGEYEIDDGPTLDRLMQCKVSLNEKLTKLCQLDEQILALVEDDDIENEIEQADQFKEKIQQSVFCVMHKISAKERNIASPPTFHGVSVESPATSVPSSDTLVTSSDTPVVSSSGTPVINSDGGLATSDGLPHDHHTTTAGPGTSTTKVTNSIVTPVPHHIATETSSSKVKLPKLEPNGDLMKWETFWSSFESAIHINPTLTAVDKFHHLISLPEGSAFAAVASLKLTEPNYHEAIDILTKRFGNKHLIISRHMDTLLELEPVESPTSIKALRQLYDKLEFQVRSLKSLGVPLDLYGNLLSSLFITRIPLEF